MSTKFISGGAFRGVMERSDQEKTLWELDPELKQKLDHLRMEARRLGLMGKMDFS